MVMGMNDITSGGVDIRPVTQLMGHGTIQNDDAYAYLALDYAQMTVDRLVYSSEQMATKSVTDRNGRKR
jgi:hypothetical protein